MASLPYVTAVTVLEHWRLRVSFNDGVTGDVDLSGLKDAGPYWEPLRDPECFAEAFVDPRSRTVAWPGDVDIAPETLYEDAKNNPVNAPKTAHRTSGVRFWQSLLRTILRATDNARPGPIR
jgi:hypothetical protein